MRRSIVSLMLVLVTAAVTQATIITLNDFESYADSSALVAPEWSKVANTALTIDTATVHSGTKSLKYSANTWNSPWYGKSEWRLPGVVWNTSGLNWREATDLSFWMKTTSSKGVFKVTIVDCYGNNMWVNWLGVVPVSDWTQVVLDITAADYTGHKMTFDELGRIGRIDFVVKPEGTVTASQHGTNTYYFDDMTLTVPEPMTMSLLALGGLLLRKRK
jgi:hypothetical protein